MPAFKSFSVLTAVTLLALLTTASAGASDLPKRKSGLWEIKMERSGSVGTPMRGPMILKICVDQHKDDLIGQRAKDMEKEVRKHCSKMETKHTGQTIVVDSVCDMAGAKVTSHNVISGNLSSAYHMESTVSADLPNLGKRTRNMVIDGKWLGPCAPGQAPGSIVSISGMSPRGKIQIDAKTMERIRHMQQEQAQTMHR